MQVETMTYILLNTNLHSGGAERQLIQIFQHLTTVGYAPSLLLLERQGVWLDEHLHPCTDARIHSLSNSAPRKTVSRVLWAIRLIVPLRSFLRQHPHAVVVGFLWLPVFLSALALTRLKPRPSLVWSVQSDLQNGFDHNLMRRLVLRLIRFVFRFGIRHFIAVSPGVQSTTQEFLGVSKELFSIIPNSIDYVFIKKQSAESSAVSERRARYRLVSVGRLHRAKGIDVLIRALHMALSRGLDVEACLIGDGEEQEYLERLVGSLPGMTSRVDFVGYSSNPYAWMASADVVVNASRWETFGIAIAEAMGLGLPVIATATDGGRHLITDGFNGFLVPINNAEALSDKIVEVMSHPAIRTRVRPQAQRRVADLDVPIVSQRYCDLLSRLQKKEH